MNSASAGTRQETAIDGQALAHSFYFADAVGAKSTLFADLFVSVVWQSPHPILATSSRSDQLIESSVRL